MGCEEGDEVGDGKLWSGRYCGSCVQLVASGVLIRIKHREGKETRSTHRDENNERDDETPKWA